jgi:hypothetical protein
MMTGRARWSACWTWQRATLRRRTLGRRLRSAQRRWTSTRTTWRASSGAPKHTLAAASTRWEIGHVSWANTELFLYIIIYYIFYIIIYIFRRCENRCFVVGNWWNLMGFSSCEMASSLCEVETLSCEQHLEVQLDVCKHPTAPVYGCSGGGGLPPNKHSEHPHDNTNK